MFLKTCGPVHFLGGPDFFSTGPQDNVVGMERLGPRTGWTGWTSQKQEVLEQKVHLRSCCISRWENPLYPGCYRPEKAQDRKFCSSVFLMFSPSYTGRVPM